MGLLFLVELISKVQADTFWEDVQGPLHDASCGVSLILWLMLTFIIFPCTVGEMQSQWCCLTVKLMWLLFIDVLLFIDSSGEKEYIPSHTCWKLEAWELARFISRFLFWILLLPLEKRRKIHCHRDNSVKENFFVKQSTDSKVREVAISCHLLSNGRHLQSNYFPSLL